MNLVEAAFIQVSGFQISPQPLEHSVDLVAKKMKATENHFFFFFKFCRVSNLERDSLCSRGAGGRGRNLKPNMEGGMLILESGAYQRGRMVKTFLGFLFNFEQSSFYSFYFLCNPFL